MTDQDEKKTTEPTPKGVFDSGTPGLSVNDDPIEYNREKPTADAWAFPY